MGTTTVGCPACCLSCTFSSTTLQGWNGALRDMTSPGPQSGVDADTLTQLPQWPDPRLPTHGKQPTSSQALLGHCQPR